MINEPFGESIWDQLNYNQLNSTLSDIAPWVSVRSGLTVVFDAIKGSACLYLFFQFQLPIRGGRDRDNMWPNIEACFIKLLFGLK